MTPTIHINIIHNICPPAIAIYHVLFRHEKKNPGADKYINVRDDTSIPLYMFNNTKKKTFDSGCSSCKRKRTKKVAYIYPFNKTYIYI